MPYFIDACRGNKLDYEQIIWSVKAIMSRKFDHLADVEALVAVVDQGSVTAAAVSLSTTPSVVSRAVSRLEARLGAQLLRRTTRRLSLTDAGRAYVDSARNAFALIASAEHDIQGQEGKLTGRVRLTVPTTYGHYRLPARLQPFLERHPEVQVELNITNRNVDLVAEGFDLAIRLGHLPSCGLVARKLEDARLCLVAAPRYLQRAGTPQTMEELDLHACIPFIMPSTGRLAPWLFNVEGQDVDWLPGSRIEVSDDVLGLVSLAECGAGVCQTYDFIVRERVERGQLVEILPQLRGRSRPFSIIYPPHRQLSPASRALVATLVEPGETK